MEFGLHGPIAKENDLSASHAASVECPAQNNQGKIMQPQAQDTNRTLHGSIAHKKTRPHTWKVSPLGRMKLLRFLTFVRTKLSTIPQKSGSSPPPVRS
ncbi:hypothetical protein L2E82_08518 [Cichorium intybus]|uniref:Uncharacterized protein n=1 Tax=Cichorium intybus TaxID=13427 RepID=A0ACB9G7N3_CICIN|nr:hypothetical protein L2E82_08518 [Cichorium intybus]